MTPEELQPELPEMPVMPEPSAAASLFETMVEGTDSKELVRSEVEEEPVAMANYSGIVQFESSDLTYPRIRLAQALTAEVEEGTAKSGQYVMTGYEAMDKLTIVPGMFARRRIYADANMDVLCRSGDSITGVGSPGGLCADCPYSHWTGSKETNDRKGPICTFMYSYIVFVAEWEAMGILDFKKTSVQAGKTVNTLAARFGLGNFGFTMKSLSQMNAAKQKFYIMTVTPTKLDPAVLDTAKQFFTLQM